MRTIKLQKPGGLDRLQVADSERVAPGYGEIVVRIGASSLNFHDYAVVTGMIPTPDGRIPMSDGAGEVVEVGEGVREFAVGDKVVSTFFPHWMDGEPALEFMLDVPGDGADGFAREYVTAPATSFTRAPQGYSDAEAATLTCAGLTAWRALVVNGQVKAGDTVLVQGTGGVSIFALQFAKAAGARVIATSSSDEKLERLRSMGADHLINYKSQENWGEVARGLTGGRGVDHVVEIGGSGTMPQSIAATRIGGHIALIGVLAGIAGNVPTMYVMQGNQRIIGLTVGARRHQQDMVRAIEANGIRPIIDKHFPLEQIADAFRHQESGKHFGKIVLDI
ncbi:zinc-dependent alcohol dehydrogenase family protein [Sphingomonas olei]|jgi:NADPH:quinone reductase-like Zn-dependent oxidoreductase|uniref:NAD(P)-dependent alcohol dehydrogenase n=1 Tax=Sphingomonas olei TaxID=1886787 RepID=A0ABY2QF64_9SPHN|nr:NAD(P)-dependent alcohol dehydrogenase [Sphingomonas olei]THG38486.1 NAD(P)-dependent alcohol dehydrogenase [Sphingomonas olei]